ncbi:MAG: C-GCAxxG-C-C family protein [Desulfobacteraceae bacterium]|jgi:hypothetical protein
MDETVIRMLQLGQQGFTCSQIIILLALELRGADNPDLVRAMGGLAYGCGSGHGSCGVLTGGCCLLALYAGKGSARETPADRFVLMLQELSGWFSRHTGCAPDDMSCHAIVGEAGPEASRQRCGRILQDTYGKVIEILTANGINPLGE